MPAAKFFARLDFDPIRLFPDERQLVLLKELKVILST
jgi:hypothetical protein